MMRGGGLHKVGHVRDNADFGRHHAGPRGRGRILDRGWIHSRDSVSNYGVASCVCDVHGVRDGMSPVHRRLALSITTALGGHASKKEGTPSMSPRPVPGICMHVPPPHARATPAGCKDDAVTLARHRGTPLPTRCHTPDRRVRVGWDVMRWRCLFELGSGIATQWMCVPQGGRSRVEWNVASISDMGTSYRVDGCIQGLRSAPVRTLNRETRHAVGGLSSFAGRWPTRDNKDPASVIGRCVVDNARFRVAL